MRGLPLPGSLFQNLTIFAFLSLVHPILDLLFTCRAGSNTAGIWVGLRELGSSQRLSAGPEGTLLDHITGPVGGEEGQESLGPEGQRLLPEEEEDRRHLQGSAEPAQWDISPKSRGVLVPDYASNPGSLWLLVWSLLSSSVTCNTDVQFLSWQLWA